LWEIVFLERGVEKGVVFDDKGEGGVGGGEDVLVREIGTMVGELVVLC